MIITTFAVALIVFCISLIIYGVNSISDNIALGILAGLSTVFTLGQWFYPFSPKQAEVPFISRARELVRGNFKMGGDDAANFHFITAPIQDSYDAAIQSLRDASTGVGTKRGVLILGETNAGKTRLAFEVLTRRLPNWFVLRWSPAYMVVPNLSELNRHNLVVFIDDLQEYVPSISLDPDIQPYIASNRAIVMQTLLDTVRGIASRVVIVATCRQEDESRVRAGLGHLFTELSIIQIRRFDIDINNPEVAKLIAEFQKHVSNLVDDWDGTLGSLVLGLSTKNYEYLKIQNEPAATVLRAMKLLKLAGTTTQTEMRIIEVCTGVFDEKVLQESKKT